MIDQLTQTHGENPQDFSDTLNKSLQSYNSLEDIPTR